MELTLLHQTGVKLTYGICPAIPQLDPTNRSRHYFIDNVRATVVNLCSHPLSDRYPKLS